MSTNTRLVFELHFALFFSLVINVFEHAKKAWSTAKWFVYVNGKSADNDRDAALRARDLRKISQFVNTVEMVERRSAIQAAPMCTTYYCYAVRGKRRGGN